MKIESGTVSFNEPSNKFQNSFSEIKQDSFLYKDKENNPDLEN